jgi:hypothetical protein
VTKRFALLLVGTLIGSLLTLAILAVAIPERLFGVSRDAVEYSLFRHAEGTARCEELDAWRWRCDVFDGQRSIDIRYDLRTMPDGCWRATSSSRTLHGCIGLRDYVRLMDR